MSAYKLRVFVAGREIGFVRRVEGRAAVEFVVATRALRATKFDVAEIGVAMTAFEGPESPSSKPTASAPRVTFQPVAC